jgi:hypothetical protein
MKWCGMKAVWEISGYLPGVKKNHEKPQSG